MEREGFDPYIATGRQRHNTTPPAATAEPATTPETPKERMRAKLGTESGRALYARRKTIVEPVFGQIKECRGFRRVSLRGEAPARAEWMLINLVHNLGKLFGSGRAARVLSGRQPRMAPVAGALAWSAA